MTRNEFLTRWLLQNADNAFAGEDDIREELREGAEVFTLIDRAVAGLEDMEEMPVIDFVAAWLLRNADTDSPNYRGLITEALTAYDVLGQELTPWRPQPRH